MSVVVDALLDVVVEDRARGDFGGWASERGSAPGTGAV